MLYNIVIISPVLSHHFTQEPLMLTSTQLRTMLGLQNGINTRINPDWLSAGYPWARAIMLESAEAMEHHGWKWWKKQDRDLAQLQMEMVDIWHFALAMMIIEHAGDLEKAAQQAATDLALGVSSVKFDGLEYHFRQMDTLGKLDLLTGLAAARRFSVPLFSSLLEDCQMSFQALYLQYVGKNILNRFRQDHGYKLGTYIKIWDGREDNEVLASILAAADVNGAQFADEVYESLKSCYPG